MRQRFDGMNVGANVDQPVWELPPQVWSAARNVRFRDGATETFNGQAQVFGSALGRPWRLLPISDGTNYYWVYCAPDAIYATDGSAHGDISPTAVNISDITNNNSPGWTGGAFQGFMVVGNGVNPPFYWTPGILNLCDRVENWPGSLNCQVIRPFRNFLFALRCSETGSYNPRLLRHSSSANPGSLPDSWDYTDPTKDTGRVEFGQSTDQIVDLIPLRDIGVLYKENHTWAIQYLGGIDNPFSYRQVFNQIGMLSEWCAASVKGQHMVLTTEDLVVHDLNQAQSIIDKQYRRWLFNQIDATNYRQSFVVPNHGAREVWVCFPEAGSTFATLALIWNYQDNTLQVRDLGAEVPHMNWGVVNEGSGIVTFDDLTGTFDEQTGLFDEQRFNPIASSLLLSDDTNLYQVDDGGTFGGTPIESYWERDALPLDKDILRWAYVKRVYPKVQGVPGDTLQVRVGTRKTQNDSVNWSSPQTFTIGQDTFVNFREMGRIISIRFDHDSINSVRMHGFDIEWDQAGYH